MMDLQVTRTPTAEKGRPDPVHIVMLDNEKKVKGTISVWPVPRAIMSGEDEFHVEIQAGSSAFRSKVDIRLVI